MSQVEKVPALALESAVEYVCPYTQTVMIRHYEVGGTWGARMTPEWTSDKRPPQKKMSTCTVDNQHAGKKRSRAEREHAMYAWPIVDHKSTDPWLEVNTAKCEVAKRIDDSTYAIEKYKTAMLTYEQQTPPTDFSVIEQQIKSSFRIFDKEIESCICSSDRKSFKLAPVQLTKFSYGMGFAESDATKILDIEMQECELALQKQRAKCLETHTRTVTAVGELLVSRLEKCQKEFFEIFRKEFGLLE